MFQFQPSACGDLRVAAEAWMVDPVSRMRHYQDLYRNPCVRIVLPAGRSTLRYAASVTVSGMPEEHGPVLEAMTVHADRVVSLTP